MTSGKKTPDNPAAIVSGSDRHQGAEQDTGGGGVAPGLRLEDIELIKQLKYRFWRSLDTMDVETMRGCFIAKPIIHQHGGSYLVHFDDREKYLEFLPKALHADVVSSHVGMHPEITVHNDHEASGIWMLLDSSMDLLRKMTTRGQAIARDKYIKENGQWKIKETTYTRVYEIVEPLTEPPRLTAHYLKEHGTQLESLDVFADISDREVDSWRDKSPTGGRKVAWDE